MTIGLPDLCVDLDDFKGEDLLGEWRWLIGSDLQPIVATVMGDVFLKSEDGCVSLLRTDLGELSRVASSVEGLKNSLKDSALVQDWFMLNLLQKLIDAGAVRGTNQVFGFVIPPVLGGEYSEKNIRVVSLPKYLNFTGDVAQQIADLPDGATLQLKVVE